MRRFDLLLLPFPADVDTQELVVLFEDLPETCVIQVLVVLEKDKREIELGEGEFELLSFPARQVLFRGGMMRFRLGLAGRVEWDFQLVVECRELSRRLREFLRVESAGGGMEGSS